MKLLTAAALLASAATAFVIPDEPMKQQLALLNKDTDTTNPQSQVQVEDALQKWWDAIPKKDTLLTSFEETIAPFFKKGFSASSLFDDLPFPHWGDHHDDNDKKKPHHPHHPPHGDPTKTIYELIKSSKYTTKFAALVDEHEELKDLLQSDQNHTLFVPTDKAFERIPPGHKDPPEAFIHALLKYHVLPGRHPLHHIAHHHTIPTNLSSRLLGHHPMRIHVSVPPWNHLLPIPPKHVTLNFFTRVIPPASDIVASNGIIHGINSILVPPPVQEKIIELLPSQFSTFRLAMEITGLGEELSKREKEEKERNGGTLFAPTNRAFNKLGPRANAFLFSEYGKKYLKLLLKYHIVANRTLFSDEFYEKPLELSEGGHHGGHHGKKEYKRIDLPSLLDDKPVSVGICRWKGFIHMRVNDKVPVVVQDGIARDGVIQVVGNVLIPPHKHHDGDHGHDRDHDHDGDDKDAEEEEEEEDDSLVDLDDLKARLESYMDSALDRESEDYFTTQDL
ncbi:Fasciclin domain containing protein [Naviculisporaceae sp. PSN 640]